MKSEKDTCMAWGEIRALDKVRDGLDAVVASVRSGPTRDFSVMYEVTKPIYDLVHEEKLKAYKRI